MADPAYVPTLVWQGDSLVWDDRTLAWDQFLEPPGVLGELMTVKADRGRDLVTKADRGRDLVVMGGMRQ